MATPPSALSGPSQGETSMSANSNSSPATPTTLAGMSNSDMATSQGDQDSGLKQVTQQVKEMQDAMRTMSGKYPAAAPSFRQAGIALRSAMRQIIANPGTPEPASPAIGG